MSFCLDDENMSVIECREGERALFSGEGLVSRGEAAEATVAVAPWSSSKVELLRQERPAPGFPSLSAFGGKGDLLSTSGEDVFFCMPKRPLLNFFSSLFSMGEAVGVVVVFSTDETEVLLATELLARADDSCMGLPLGVDPGEKLLLAGEE